MTLNSAEGILDFAIEKEQDAVDFYTELAGKVAAQHMRDLLRSFAKEEQRHKAKLQEVKKGGIHLFVPKKVMDLKIADYLPDADVAGAAGAAEIDYQDALIIAMKREKSAFKLYKDLSTTTEDADLKELFLSLAQEEAKHKLFFEIEYDEHILTDN
ncbi:MAG: ferritin family protein [Deltaproteobacteria bacterium]|nr:ferritin family protein [Deltaproteobacteria bacterium]